MDKGWKEGGVRGGGVVEGGVRWRSGQGVEGVGEGGVRGGGVGEGWRG